MKLGLENREQVFFLAGLVAFAGYMMYVSWIPGHRATAPNPAPAHPSAPRQGRKAIGLNNQRDRMEFRSPGARL